MRTSYSPVRFGAGSTAVVAPSSTYSQLPYELSAAPFSLIVTHACAPCFELTGLPNVIVICSPGPYDFASSANSGTGLAVWPGGAVTTGCAGAVDTHSSPLTFVPGGHVGLPRHFDFA